MKNAWQTFFRVVVHMMKKGYANLIIAKPLNIATDQKALITEVQPGFDHFVYCKNAKGPVMQRRKYFQKFCWLFIRSNEKNHMGKIVWKSTFLEKLTEAVWGQLGVWLGKVQNSLAFLDMNFFEEWPQNVRVSHVAQEWISKLLWNAFQAKNKYHLGCGKEQS